MSSPRWHFPALLLACLYGCHSHAFAAGSDLSSTPAESEAEQAGAIGACRVLEGRGLWRYVSRDWGALRAVMLALLASGE